MGFRVNTNIASMNAYRNSTMNNIGLDKSLNALSSGLRINKAADDSAGLAISNKLSVQSQGLGQAIKNSNNGIGLLQTADGAMQEMTNIAQRMRVLAVQGANDSQDADSRSYINKEIQALNEAFADIRNTTKYNGIGLLDSSHNVSTNSQIVSSSVSADSLVNGNSQVVSSTVNSSTITGSQVVSSTITNSNIIGTQFVSGNANNATIIDGVLLSGTATGVINASGMVTGTGEFTFHTGAYESDTQSVTIGNASISQLYQDGLGGGFGFLNLNPISQSDFEQLVQDMDYILKGIDLKRATIGSAQNKLESTIRNISVTQVNLESARSQIQDVDFASESANFSKKSIIAQSGSYAISQANANPESVIRILESSA